MVGVTLSSLAASSSAAPTPIVVHLGGPLAIAAGDRHVWVTDGVNNSVAELNATNGSLVRDISAQADGLNGPFTIAVSGTHVWIVNQSGSSVTELNASDGSWVRTLSGGSYGFNFPDCVAFDGTHLWVTNYANSVTELNASNATQAGLLNP